MKLKVHITKLPAHVEGGEWVEEEIVIDTDSPRVSVSAPTFREALTAFYQRVKGNPVLEEVT